MTDLSVIESDIEIFELTKHCAGQKNKIENDNHVGNDLLKQLLQKVSTFFVICKPCLNKINSQLSLKVCFVLEYCCIHFDSS